VNITVTEISPSRKKIEVVIPVKTVDATEAEVLKQFMRNAKVDGFRRGKASEALVRRSFADKINEEWRQNIIQKAYQFAKEETGLEIDGVTLETPDFELQKGQEVNLVLECEIWPSTPVEGYNGLKLEIPAQKPVAEADVDAMLKEMLNEAASFERVHEAAQPEDFVKLSYKGTIEGLSEADVEALPKIYTEQVQTWEKAKDPTDDLTIVIPAIVNALVGAKDEDQLEASFTFPDDFHIEALQGKTAQYAITVHEISRRKLMDPADPVFLKRFNAESLEQLKERLNEHLNEMRERSLFNVKAESVLTHLREKHNVVAPEFSVQKRSHTLLQGFLSSERGKMLTRLPEDKQREVALTVLEDCKKRAEKDLANDWVLLSVIKKESLKPTEEELSEMMRAEMYVNRVSDPNAYMRNIMGSEEGRRAFFKRCSMHKALAFLLENNTFTEVEASKD
jgi:trigger factor